MRKAGFLIVILLLSAIVFAIDVEQVEQGGAIVQVEVYNAQISQGENSFEVTFDLTNNGSAQTNLSYGLELIGIESGFFADDYIIDDLIYIGKAEVIPLTVNYSPPKYLDGAYEVWVSVVNEKGSTVAMNFVDTINLTATEDIVEIYSQTCKMYLSGEPSEYSLSLGTLVLPGEDLLVACEIENHLNKPVLIYPVFESHERNVWGPSLGIEKQTGITFGLDAEEKRKVIITIPAESIPQAYDSRIYFESNGERISNDLIAHYVVSGESGTVQNISLDKSQYVVGEIAKITVYWTPSADAYPDSRNISGMENGSIVVTALSSSGAKCFEDVIIEGVSTLTNTTLHATAVITNECTDPTLDVGLLNEAGAELDSLVAQYESRPEPEEETDGAISAGLMDFTSALILIGAIVGIALIAGGWNLLQKKKKAPAKKEVKDNETSF